MSNLKFFWQTKEKLTARYRLHLREQDKRGAAVYDGLRWLGFLALYDVVFVLLAVAVFDYLLED
jgi:hypothetical protein